MRQAVAEVPGATLREACDVLEVCRAGVYYTPRPRPRDERLKAALPPLARRLPRFGYRRLCQEICRSLEHVSRDTIQRLCRVLDLRVKPLRKGRRRKYGAPVIGLRAEFPQHVWCLDFLKDRTRDGRPLRFLSVVDEHTRRCLALQVARRFTAADVVGVLQRLIGEYGVPTNLRSDNGPEFVATTVEAWAARQQIRLVRSTPASPWENPFIESFHGRLRDECVEREDFGSLVEAQIVAETYRVWYNEVRMHSALHYQTPAAFTAAAEGGQRGRMVEVTATA